MLRRKQHRPIWSLVAFGVGLAVAGEAFAASGGGCNVIVTIKHGDPVLGRWENSQGPTNVILCPFKEYTFSASCDCDHDVNLTSSFGKSAGPAQTPSFTHTFETTDDSENATSVTATCATSSQTSVAQVTLIAVAITDGARRMPPRVTMDPKPRVCPWFELTGNRYIGVDVKRTYGTGGEATLDPTQVQTSTDITVTATAEQTAVGQGDNMQVQALVSGDIIAYSTCFTICAHMTNWRMTKNWGFPENYGMSVAHEWDTDSGEKADLAVGAIKQAERNVNFYRDKPPFNTLPPPEWMENWCHTGALADRHRCPAEAVSVGECWDGAVCRHDQTTWFKCWRCGLPIPQWEEIPETGFRVSFEVHDYDKDEEEEDFWMETWKRPTSGHGGPYHVDENIPD